MSRAGIVVVLCAVLSAGAGIAKAQTTSAADAAIDQLRKDVRADKTQIISAAMGFTADENASFWPLYKTYEQTQKSLGDEKVALIKDYAANFEAMTDAKAKEMIVKAQAIEDKSTAAKRNFIKSLEGVLPAKKVARYYQVENRIQMLMDLALASEIPLVK